MDCKIRPLLTLVLLTIIFSSYVTYAQAVTIKVGVTVVSFDDLGMRPEDMQSATLVNSTLWRTKQCCLQQGHRLGLRSDYCLADDMRKRLKGSACMAFGIISEKKSADSGE